MVKRVIAILVVGFFVSNAAYATTVVVDVNGLVCEFCAVTIEKNFIKKKDSVEAVKVDLDSKKVTISLQEGKDISDDEVRETIVNNGYNVVAITREE